MAELAANFDHPPADHYFGQRLQANCMHLAGDNAVFQELQQHNCFGANYAMCQ